MQGLIPKMKKVATLHLWTLACDQDHILEEKSRDASTDTTMGII